MCKLPTGWDWPWVKLGLALVDKDMLIKSLIQFSADEWGCVPALYFDLGPNYVGIMATSFKRTCANMLCLPGLLLSVALTPWHVTVDPGLHQRLPNTQASLAQSLEGPLLLSPGSWCTQCFVSAF